MARRAPILWPASARERKVAESVVASLRVEDLKLQYRQWHAEKGCDPMTGHCFNATNAFWHLMGGLGGPYVPFYLNDKRAPEILDKDESHWFLVDRRLIPGSERMSNMELLAHARKHRAIVDLTASQFTSAIPYELAGRSSMRSTHYEPRGDVVPTKEAEQLMARAVSRMTDRSKGLSSGRHVGLAAGKKASKSSSRQPDQVSPEEYHRLLASWMEQVARQETLEATTTGELAEMYAWDLGYQGERLPQRLIDLAAFEGVDVVSEHRAGILAKKNED